MRRLLLIILLIAVANKSFSQALTLQQKLYYTSKVWGFVKFYHSSVSVCAVNWDSVLLHVLPMVRTAATSVQFNDALDTMLAAAGPMTLATTPFPDTLAPALKRNRDWSWISSPVLRSDVQIQLDTIKNNFRPHPNCWVQNNTFWFTMYSGWLVFNHDSLGVNMNTTVSFPDADTRQLAFFKYWNLLSYFNPYNYVLDRPIDSTFLDYVIPMDTATTSQSLFYTYRRIAHALDNYDASFLTHGAFQAPPGSFQPFLRLGYMDGRYVVIKSMVSDIAPGDAVLAIDGLTVTQWEDSLRQYYSAGNAAAFHRNMCENLLGRLNYGITENILVEDSAGATAIHTANTYPTSLYYSFFGATFYPNDSISADLWKVMQCDIGYVNMENMPYAGVAPMYAALRHKSAIIFDLRNNTTDAARQIAQLMSSSRRVFAKEMLPSVEYPGTFYWQFDSLGTDTNSTPYTGKVIILVNEKTKLGEFACMIFEALPNSVKIGSQTAGTNLYLTYWRSFQDIAVGNTSWGVFYPNGDSTQRIGIVPDSVVTPTRLGIRHSRDEVLEKALVVAGCVPVSVPGVLTALPSAYIHPNPSSDMVTVELKFVTNAEMQIVLTDVTGKTLQQADATGKASQSFNVSGLAAGMYFIKVSAGGNSAVYKLIKQ